MVLPIIGGAMMLGGTAMNMLGTHKRDKATKRALKEYQEAVNAKAAQDRAALGEEQGALYGLADERQRGIGGYLNQLSMAQRPGTDEGFRDRQTGVLSDIGRQTQGMDSAFAYSGQPRTDSERMQGGITANRNAKLAEALMADYETKQIDERERSAGVRMSLGDLMRSGKGKSMQERFALARALRDLDWQRKTAAMQGNLDSAQQKGQWMNTLGGLSTQMGGMAITAGLAGGGGGTTTDGGLSAQAAADAGVGAGGLW